MSNRKGRGGAKGDRRLRYRSFGTLGEGPLFLTGRGLLDWLKQFNKTPKPVERPGPLGPRRPKHEAGNKTYFMPGVKHYWPSVGRAPVPSADKLDPLLHEVDAVLDAAGVSQSRFGLLAVGDAALVSRMRRGMHVKSAKRRAKITTALDEIRAALAADLAARKREDAE